MGCPKHLKGIFHPTGRDGTEGDIICECGCKKFGIKYFGEPYKGYICIQQREEKLRFSLVVKAVCPECGKEWLLFDYAKHAYNGYLCEEGVNVADDELKCYSNGEDSLFEIKLGFELMGEKDFEEDVLEFPPEGISLTLEDRFDIWDWVDIVLIGASSGREIGFVNQELA